MLYEKYEVNRKLASLTKKQNGCLFYATREVVSDRMTRTHRFHRELGEYCAMTG